MMDYGVIVASDSDQEWLLPWWWENYHEENTLPVCFADLGMSEKAKSWCQKRGQCVDVLHFNVAQKEEIEPKRLMEWEKSLSPFWRSRNAWFKKPFALLKTPFQKSIWLDLDCEVMALLNPIFDHLKSQAAIMKAHASLYNSGVIVYEKNAPLLQKWAELALKENHRFLSDQDALSAIICQEKIFVDELPEIYNWLMCRGLNINAKILHWAAQWGKSYIKKYGGLKKQMRDLFSSPWEEK